MDLTDTETQCLVFRTSLQDKTDVERITDTMNSIPGIQTWSVDLEDWEKVLRVEGTGIQAREIISRLRFHNVAIREMPI